MFHNIDPNVKPKGLFDILKWKITAKRSEWSVLPELTSFDIPPNKIASSKELRVSYIGHVTFLIQIGGLNIL
ncbi:MAG: hydrolase, partial [Rickettsia endosymbiont of Pentastiridius leporinus]